MVRQCTCADTPPRPTRRVVIIIEWRKRLGFIKIVGVQNTTPSGCACHPSSGGEWGLAAALAQALYHAKLGSDFGKFGHCLGGFYIGELALQQFFGALFGF